MSKWRIEIFDLCEMELVSSESYSGAGLIRKFFGEAMKQLTFRMNENPVDQETGLSVNIDVDSIPSTETFAEAYLLNEFGPDWEIENCDPGKDYEKGHPDLIARNGLTTRYIEVKSGGDTLSHNQLSWVVENRPELNPTVNDIWLFWVSKEQ